MKEISKSVYKVLILMLFGLVLSGCVNNDLSGPEVEEYSLPETNKISQTVSEKIEVQASDELIDRSHGEWMNKYCVEKIRDISDFPGKFEKMRGPFITLEPIYLADRHSSFSSKVTCNLDYYIWPVRVESFESMGIDYGYSLPVWEKYWDAVYASVSAKLKDEGWKEQEIKDDAGVKPDYMLYYNNSNEKLREYLDIFYTNDEEVVFELLIVDTNK